MSDFFNVESAVNYEQKSLCVFNARRFSLYGGVKIRKSAGGN